MAESATAWQCGVRRYKEAPPANAKAELLSGAADDDDDDVDGVLPPARTYAHTQPHVPTHTSTHTHARWPRHRGVRQDLKALSGILGDMKGLARVPLLCFALLLPSAALTASPDPPAAAVRQTQQAVSLVRAMLGRTEARVDVSVGLVHCLMRI